MSPTLILVDEQDRPIGTAEKLEVHRKGLLHRAFSVFLFNDSGQLLLQRRADGKYHSGGLWSNTCCGHLYPGEEIEDSARRGLQNEMGLQAEIKKRFVYIYRVDFGNGLTEHEVDHIFTGTYNGSPDPNPEEASAWRWISLEDLQAEMAAQPETFTFWSKGIIKGHLDELL